jgi:hypothetical protein
MPERYAFTQRYELQRNSVPNTQCTLATAQRLERNGAPKNRHSTVTCSTTTIRLLLKETQILYIFPDYELELKLIQLLTTGDTNKTECSNSPQYNRPSNRTSFCHRTVVTWFCFWDIKMEILFNAFLNSALDMTLVSFKLCPLYSCA